MRIALLLLAIVAVSANEIPLSALAIFNGEKIKGTLSFGQAQPILPQIDYFCAITGLPEGNYIGLMGKPSSFNIGDDKDLTKWRPPTIIFRRKWTDQSLSGFMGSITGASLTEGTDNSIFGMIVTVYRDPGGSNPVSQLQNETEAIVTWSIVEGIPKDPSTFESTTTDCAEDEYDSTEYDEEEDEHFDVKTE